MIDHMRDRAKSALELERMTGADPIVDMQASEVEALCDLADAWRNYLAGMHIETRWLKAALSRLGEGVRGD